MDLITAVKERHSVRSYTDKKIESEKVKALKNVIDDCNERGDLHIQLVTNEPKAFDGFMARYGNFSGVCNYVALIGKKSKDLQEKIGYYGAKIMLEVQTLGLNSCWVALTYKKVKTAFAVDKGEKLCGVIAIGYGATTGFPRKSKTFGEVASCEASAVPEWYKNGVETALLAPTAMNQQKFRFNLSTEGKAEADTSGGFYTKTDLGIVKYFFNVGAGFDCFKED